METESFFNLFEGGGVRVYQTQAEFLILYNTEKKVLFFFSLPPGL